jgi:hypothetical protein
MIDDEKARDLRIKNNSSASAAAAYEASHNDRDDTVKIKEELKLLQRR